MANCPCTCYFKEVLVEGSDGSASPLSFHGLEQTVYRVGSHDIAIYKEDSRMCGDVLRSEDGEPVDRTGMLMWPGGTVIAHALLTLGHRGFLAGRSVLELGSGVGFCGIVASLFAREVVLTDQSAEVRDIARENLRANEHLLWQSNDTSSQAHCLATVSALAWPGVGHAGQHVDETGSCRFDLVIASDVLYVEEPRFGGLDQIELRCFCKVIQHKLAPGGLALVAYANREPRGAELICEAAGHSGLQCVELPARCFVAEELLRAEGATFLSCVRVFQLTDRPNTLEARCNSAPTSFATSVGALIAATSSTLSK